MPLPIIRAPFTRAFSSSSFIALSVSSRIFCGISITFDLEGTEETVEVFTTRPDTLMGVTYIVLAPEHPLTLKIATDERRAVSAVRAGMPQRGTVVTW